jgi:hypothetical protein
MRALARTWRGELAVDVTGVREGPGTLAIRHVNGAMARTQTDGERQVPLGVPDASRHCRNSGEAWRTDRSGDVTVSGTTSGFAIEAG